MHFSPCRKRPVPDCPAGAFPELSTERYLPANQAELLRETFPVYNMCKPARGKIRGYFLRFTKNSVLFFDFPLDRQQLPVDIMVCKEAESTLETSLAAGTGTRKKGKDASMKRKILTDIGMTAVLPMLMAYGLIGENTHEWLGMAMFALFLTHLLLNRKWFGALGRGRYSPARIAQAGLNCLIFLCMIGCMVSGMILSRYLFAFLPAHGGYALAGKAHMLCAFWGFILMCLHLGTHWEMLRAIIRKKWKLTSRGERYLRILCCLAALCGVPAFLHRNLSDYLLLRSHFVFYDYSEPAAFFLWDYLLIMVLFAALGHWEMRLLRTRKKKNSGK